MGRILQPISYHTQKHCSPRIHELNEPIKNSIMKTFHTTIKKLYKIISWEEAAAPSEYKP
jgi:hypothetical protein